MRFREHSLTNIRLQIFFPKLFFPKVICACLTFESFLVELTTSNKIKQPQEIEVNT